MVEGLCSKVVTYGFISVNLTEEIEEGGDLSQKNAWGEYCLQETDDDIMKWVNVSVQFCEVDPDILDIIGGATPVIVGGNTIGWTRGPSAPVGTFALEVWSKRAGQDACAPGGVIEWGYTVIPFIKNGRLDGAINIENAPLNITMVGKGFAAPASWGVGPHGDNPFLAIAGFPAGQTYGMVVTTVAPPAVTVGCSPVFRVANVKPGDVFDGAAFPTILVQDATNAAKLTPLGFITDPANTTAWLTGEFMSVGLLKFNWTGTAWAAGVHA